MKRIFLVILMFSGITGILLYAEDLRVVINSGHTRAVRYIDIDERENLLFSCGDDGTIRAWDTETKKLVNLLQISHYPVLQIVLHPTKPQVAAVQKSGINSYRLTVWDWKEKRELFTKTLEELPLHIDYSPKGSYLVYSKTSWDSLTFLQSSSGRQLDYLEKGFGIVTHFAVSPRENTIITYGVSGRIDYYDIRGGERKYSFSTLPDLEKIEFTGNLRFMAASDTERFVLIDLTNGSVIAEAELPGIETISANMLTGDIMCLYPSEKGTQVSILNLISDGLEERTIGTTSGFIPGPGVFHINTLYIPKASGDIGYFSCMEDKEEQYISRNRLARINNLAFFQDEMAFGAGDSIFLISSDFFLGGKNYRSPSYFDVGRFETSFSGQLNVASLSNDKILAWQQDPGIIEYLSRDNEDSDDEHRRLTLSSELTQVTPYEEKILILQGNGTCSLLDGTTLDTTFSYPGFGIRTAALVDNYIFLGKSKASGFNASILKVNSITGETVPVFDNSILIYEARYQNKSDVLYALTVDRYSNRTKTVLKSYRPPDFDRSRELLSYNGEDLTAHVAVDPETSEIYTTLGFEGVTEIKNRYNTREFRQLEHIPRKPLLHKNLLYTINTDYSITVWNRESKQRIMDFYMFEDMEWIALLAEGRYYASPGADEYIGIYDGTEQLPPYRSRTLRIN